MYLRVLLLGAALTVNASVQAQSEADWDEWSEDEIEEVRVVAGRLDFGVEGDFDPEVSYDQRSIRALAVSSLDELLQEIAPDLVSSRGRFDGPPVVLVNGQRIADFREIRALPPEALERVEVYPEDLALQYGFRADQKVVNFVLRPRFRANAARLSAGGSMQGGAEAFDADLGHLRILRGTRLHVNADLDRQQALHESDRDVALLDRGNDAQTLDDRTARTLVAEQRSATIAASYALPLRDQVSATISAEYTASRSATELGFAQLWYEVPAIHPLQRDQQTDSYDLNATLAGRWQGWSWSWLNSFNQFQRVVSTDRGVVAEPSALVLQRERETSEGVDLSSRLLIRGVLFDGPQGPAQTSASVAWQSARRDSETALGGSISRNDLDRDTFQARISLNTPLFESASGARVSLNTNVELADYSDFGNLNVLGAGLNWRVNQSLRLNASLSREEGPPEMTQLGDPLSRSPNRRVFDFVSGRTESVALISGGNPDLSADTRTVLNLGLQLEPFDQHDLSFTLNYVDSDTEDPIVRFPNPSEEIEAAFPARFVRDAVSGALLEFDTRPINLDNEQRRALRWGLRYSRVLRIDPDRLRAERERAAARPRPGNDTAHSSRARERFFARRSAQGAGGFGGRLRLALDHSYTLEDELTIAPGLAPIDYVGIGNAGRRSAGAEHEVTLRGSYSYRSWTARFNLTWQDATRSLPGPSGRLQFSDLWRAELDLVYSFDPRAEWVRRFALQFARVKLTVTNLFDDKRRVEDQFGTTPLGLSADEIDPVGRGVYLEFRKLFR